MTQANANEQLGRLMSDSGAMQQDAEKFFLAGSPDVIGVLLEALKDPRFRGTGHHRILLLLAKLQRPETLPAVIDAYHRAMEARDFSAITGALEALSAFQFADSVQAIASALASPDTDIVKHAAIVIGRTH